MWRAKSGIFVCLLGCLFILRNGTALPIQDLSRAANENIEAPLPGQASPITRDAITFNSFPVGAGGSDVIPHQIVRTNTDKTYIFGYKGAYSNIIVAYWSNTTGLPTSATTFSSASTPETNFPLSVEVAYDGGKIIHVLDNTVDGNLNDHIFDTSTNTFKANISLATGNPPVSGDYIGTSGVSAMVGSDQTLRMAFWSSGKNITYREYTYNDTTLSLSLVSGSVQQLDTSGKANHPALAISPVNGNTTVAWLSEAGTSPKIIARTKSSGSWGAVEPVSTAVPWTSTVAGINIDQGPSLVIDGSGTRHLTYIQDYDNTNDYGRIHYVTNSGSSWTDTALAAYSHDPALAINSQGEVYIIGHGHHNNVSCTSNLDMCVSKKNTNNMWGNPALFAQHTGNNSFDTSPSVKWSVVGFNRPETIELIVPYALNQNYANTILYYGTIISSAVPPTPTPTSTPTQPPTPTPTQPPPPPLQVTGINDYGDITDAGTLSYALDKAVAGQTVSFNLTSGSTVNIYVKIPAIKSGVRLRYTDATPGANCNQPITLNAKINMVPGGANLQLSGQNIIEGIIISTFSPGPGIITAGRNNKIRCSKVQM